MIHSSKIHELVEVHLFFSIAWIAESGEKIFVGKCRCTSFHSSGDTLNILIVDRLNINKTICKGETLAEKLASLSHGNCRKSEVEIAKALHSNGKSFANN